MVRHRAVRKSTVQFCVAVVLHGSVMGCAELCRFGKARLGMMSSWYYMVLLGKVKRCSGVAQYGETQFRLGKEIYPGHFAPDHFFLLSFPDSTHLTFKIYENLVARCGNYE